MSDHNSHVRQIQEKADALSTALAELARGDGIKELLKIIHFPGYTTPAELAFTLGILEDMTHRARGLATMERALLSASRMIVAEGQKAA
jgi:hypothetical protein